MIARSFKSVIWVATVGGAALACYMVSLRVATERADLAKVEHQILAAKREIRMLQTELGTRGRMSQLDDWNANVLALSAPTAAQFVHDDLTLARLERRDATVADRAAAPARLASAETGAAAAPAPAAEAAAPAPAEAPKPPRVVTAVAHAPPPPHPALHQASYTPPMPAALPEASKRSPKADRHAKADPAKKGATDRKVASAAPPGAARKDKSGPRTAPDKRLASAAKPAAAKLLAHARPARRPVAAQESDSD
jgi:hypothetical protein